MARARSDASESHQRRSAEDWGIRLQVWLDREGRAVLGPAGLELFEEIDHHQSISAAARKLGLTYRRAWEMVRDVSAAAGELLVTTAAGGAGGGGANLTLPGRRAVDLCRGLQTRLQKTATGLLASGGVPAATLQIFAALSLEEVLGLVLADFAAEEPGIKVRAVYAGSDQLVDMILSGASADLLLSADQRQIDRLAEAGLVPLPGGLSFADNQLVAVGLSARTARIRRAADLVANGTQRIALADTGCPLGWYTRAYLQAAGIYDVARRRAVMAENARAVAAAVRGGQADFGLVYATDARSDSLRTLFRIRRPRTPIRYFATLLTGGRDPIAAQRVLDFLISPAARQRFRECGFQPHRAKP